MECTVLADWTMFSLISYKLFASQETGKVPEMVRVIVMNPENDRTRIALLVAFLAPRLFNPAGLKFCAISSLPWCAMIILPTGVKTPLITKDEVATIGSSCETLLPEGFMLRNLTL